MNISQEKDKVKYKTKKDYCYIADLAIDNEGNLSVAWTREFRYIYFSRSTDNGVTWTQPVDIGIDFEETFLLAIEVDSNGYIYVVWSADEDEIYFTSSTNHGMAWVQPIRITELSESARPIGFTIDKDGIIYVLWTADKGVFPGFTAYVSISYNGGISWSQSINICDLNNSSFSYLSSIASDKAENIHVTWTDDDNPILLN